MVYPDLGFRGSGVTWLGRFAAGTGDIPIGWHTEI
jgi:hypothetical protein